jgi:hypothetical protein
MTHERIEEIENKFKAFSNEHINDYHGEEAWFYTKPALETAIKVNIADTLALVRQKIATYKSYYNPIGDERNTGKHEAMTALDAELVALISQQSKESGIYLKECIDKI